MTFEKDLVHVEGKPLAELVAPGHPLLEAVLDITLERHRTLLRQGAVLIDPADEGTEPSVLVFLEHAVTDARDDGHGNRRTVSRRFEFVEVPEAGDASPGSYAPYLDLRPATDAELSAIRPLVKNMDWFRVTSRTGRSTTESTSSRRNISPKFVHERSSASPR